VKNQLLKYGSEILLFNSLRLHFTVKFVLFNILKTKSNYLFMVGFSLHW